MVCISSVSTPCLVLILFFHREECDARREVSKQKKCVFIGSQHRPLLMEGVFGLQQPLQEPNEVGTFFPFGLRGVLSLQ